MVEKKNSSPESQSQQFTRPGGESLNNAQKNLPTLADEGLETCNLGGGKEKGERTVSGGLGFKKKKSCHQGARSKGGQKPEKPDDLQTNRKEKREKGKGR